MRPSFYYHPHKLHSQILSQSSPMSSNPEIIDLSSSSSESSDGWNSYFPPIAQNTTQPVSTNQTTKRNYEEGESSKPPIPAESDSTDDVRPLTDYFPSGRELVSPFVFTSDEESSEDEYGDPTFVPPSTPERPQTRPGRSNPQHPKDREVVIGLPAMKNGVSAEGSR